MYILENAALGTLYAPSLLRAHPSPPMDEIRLCIRTVLSLVAIAWHSIPDQVVQMWNFLSPCSSGQREIDTIGYNSMQLAERPR